jgi:hypothetical protein
MGRTTATATDHLEFLRGLGPIPGTIGADEYRDMVEADRMAEGEVCCAICDGLGHGQPGYGPCPLEEAPWWADGPEPLV